MRDLDTDALTTVYCPLCGRMAACYQKEIVCADGHRTEVVSARAPDSERVITEGFITATTAPRGGWF